MNIVFKSLACNLPKTVVAKSSLSKSWFKLLFLLPSIAFEKSFHRSCFLNLLQLDADTSLLKYAILSPSLSETYKLLHTILEELKTSIGAHKTIDTLGSSEQFFEFVRALFMISLALAFSPVQQDRNVAEYIQQLSVELYLHLCNHNKIQRVTRLSHSAKSVKLMNASLNVLGLPSLLGVLQEETETASSVESQRSEKQNFSKSLPIPEIKREEGKENKNAAIGNQDAETSDLHCGHDADSSNLNRANSKGTVSLLLKHLM